MLTYKLSSVSSKGNGADGGNENVRCDASN